MKSRQKQISNVLSKKVNSQRENFLRKQVSSFIKFQNNKYTLNLSHEECERIGISPLEYKKIMVDLEKRNNLNQEINLSKWTEKTLGTLQSIGTETVSEGFWAPRGAKAVEFSCISYAAATPGFTCQTKALGTFHIQGKFGTIGKLQTITVPLAASDCGVEIFFHTTDSNGGLARWKLIF